ncbi:hypothetical protein L3Q82_020345, partial [Scortum barcoo]
FLKLKKNVFNFSGPEPDITAIVQNFPSDPVRPGDSVTLQCSVLSDYENKTCPGQHSVYWFRAGSDGAHPTLIYVQRTNNSDQCEKSPEPHSPQKCVYNFSKNVSSSDAGNLSLCCGHMWRDIIWRWKKTGRSSMKPPRRPKRPKPLDNGEVRAKWTDAYNSGDLEEYRKSRYALWRAISSAKRQYRDKVESHYQGSNTRSMWAGLKTLTDYKRKISSAEVMSASLPDKLNTFYDPFESTSPAVEVQKAQEDHCPPVISRADVCRTLKRINTRKSPGPDGIPGRALKETIIVPRKTKILSLNDYRPVALTSTIMKCFERSTEDAIALTLHTALSHLDQRDTYVRMLFIDYSSAFNTIVPSKLITKLRDLGLNSALCDWILNFLTGRPQAVRIGQHHILHPDSEHQALPSSNTIAQVSNFF